MREINFITLIYRLANLHVELIIAKLFILT